MARTSGRACFYAYWRDADPSWCHVAAQWREGAELGTGFPCDGGLVLVLLQTPAARAAAFGDDLEATYPAHDRGDPGARPAANAPPVARPVRTANSWFVWARGPAPASKEVRMSTVIRSYS